MKPCEHEFTYVDMIVIWSAFFVASYEFTSWVCLAIIEGKL